MITYTPDTTTIVLSHPRHWDPALLTDVTLTVADRDGNELQAATSAALYTATTLDADRDRFASSITLSAGAGALVVGDIIRIQGVNGYEDHTVKGYDAATRTVLLELILGRDFEDGADVYRLSSVATVDFSTYSPGTQLLLTWTPTGTGNIFTELAEIEESSQINVAAFTRDFKALYPRAYDALSVPADRLDTIIRLCQDELRTTFAAQGLNISRLKDQRLLVPPLMALVARYWTLNGDEALRDEREIINAAYSAAVQNLRDSPVWVDLDNDGIEEDGETLSHSVIFERVW